jgi:hypothetical protein|tara:strand:+ start:1078 stop:1311 length:234 start_codon:yes stop_codon:yes gene_type:complete
MAKPEKFEKEGLEGVWRPLARHSTGTLDIYELEKTKTIFMDGTEGGDTIYVHHLVSKKFTNKNLAKDFFLKFKINAP